MNAVAAPPRRLGRFELLRELGRGAQAQVWLAHDPRLDREVALKLLDPNADADAVSQWLHEARAVSRLTHPNIVPVFEADEHEGQSYLVFEFVDGPTLSAARRSQPLMPAREAVQLLLGVLDALAAAHEPVSYTHLDVYKRQPLAWCGQALRVDRLVALDEGGRTVWWVLDYKLQSDPTGVPAYRDQLRAYVEAVQALQPDDEVRGAFITGRGAVLIA